MKEEFQNIEKKQDEKLKRVKTGMNRLNKKFDMMENLITEWMNEWREDKEDREGEFKFSLKKLILFFSMRI